MKRSFTTLVLLMLFLTIRLYSQAVGDYGSAMSGNWGTSGTWVVCQTQGQWTDATPAPSAPTSTTNVWIRSGTVVTVDASGKTCNNLYIENTGQLKCGVTLPSSTIRYVRIYGSTVQNNGTIGYVASDSSDAISFEIYGSSVTFTGTGSTRIARIRPGSNVTTSSVTFDQDVTMTYAGTSGTGGSAIYTSNSGNTNCTVTLNSGRTLTCLPYANIATSSSSSGNGSTNTIFNFNGTVNMGAGANLGLAVANGFTCTTTIGSGAVVNVGQNIYDTTVVTGGTVTLNVNAGGTLNCATGGSGTINAPAATMTINGIFDVGNSSTTTRNFGNATVSSTGKIRFMDSVYATGGNLILSPGSTLEYYGTKAINLDTTVKSYSNLVINNSAGVKLGTSVQVNGNLNLLNGILTTSDTTLLTLSSTSNITGASSSNYINGPLALTLATANVSNLTFPIGKDLVYRPVILNITQNSATPTVYTAEVINSAPVVNTLASTLNKISLTRYYKLSKSAGANITDASIELSYGADDSVTVPSNLRIAEGDASNNWTDLGGTGSAVTTGNITSSTNFTTLSNFALANASENLPPAGSVGDYISFKSGNWSDNSTWYRWDGTQWVNPAPSAPTSALPSNVIHIRSGHIVNVDVNVTVDSVYIDTLATLNINKGDTLFVQNTTTTSIGAKNLYVNGTMNVYGTLKDTILAGSVNSNGGVVSVGAGGVLNFANGSTYWHARDGGSIPTSTWDSTSTCLITGVVSTAPSNANQNFYNFTWDCPNQGSSVNLGWSGNTIGGTITCNNTKTSQFRWTNNNANGGNPITITIKGDVIVNNAAIMSPTSSGAALVYTINQSGNIYANGTSQLYVCGTSNTGAYVTWNVNGNISAASGALLKSSNSISRWKFNSGRNQTMDIGAPGVISSNVIFEVANGTAVQLTSPVTINRLVLTSGKIVSTSTNLLTLGTVGSLTGGSSTAYIEGPMSHQRNNNVTDTLFFPIAKGGIYRPVTLMLTPTTTTTSSYTAEMFNSVPPVNSLPSSLKHISNTRYYVISEGSGGSAFTGGTVTLNYDTSDEVTNASLLRIAQGPETGSGTWINLGGTGSANTTGFITSTNTFTDLTTNTVFVLADSNTTVPSAPVLAQPDSGAVNVALAPKLNWNKVTDAATYQIQVSTSSLFTSTIVDSAGITDTSFALTGLTPNTLYYWRVNATNTGGTSAWSKIYAFTTINPPSAPVLALPDSGATNVSLTPTLTWNKSAGALKYNLQVSNSAVFSTNLVDTTGLADTSFTLANLSEKTSYFWRVSATNTSATSSWSKIFSFTTGTATGIEKSGLSPKEFGITQNYPNPFNPSTVINYSVPKEVVVSIKIYNSLGQLVKTLVNENKSSGVYSVTWFGDNNLGAKVTSGVYFYRITAGNYIQVKKMLLLK